MGVEKLDELLKRMPEIAKAVNAFSSEVVQQRAFSVLVTSFGGVDDTVDDGDEDEVPDGDGTPPKPLRKKAAKKAGVKKAAGPAKKKVAVGSPKMVGNLNLRPSGKKSLKDFVAAKAPANQDERNAVAVYYLKHELKVDKVSGDHVFTCYREMKDDGWRLPNDLRNSLQQTKSRSGWIDTGDMDDIKISASGINTVEQDLPKKSK